MFLFKLCIYVCEVERYALWCDAMTHWNVIICATRARGKTLSRMVWWRPRVCVCLPANWQYPFIIISANSWRCWSMQNGGKAQISIETQTHAIPCTHIYTSREWLNATFCWHKRSHSDNWRWKCGASESDYVEWDKSDEMDFKRMGYNWQKASFRWWSVPYRRLPCVLF